MQNLGNSGNYVSLKDPRLKIPPELFYLVCVPLRLTIAMIFILYPEYIMKYKFICFGFFLFLFAGFISKYINAPHKVWKPYLVSIILYLLCAILSLTNNIEHYRIIGTLLISDVISGMTSKHILDT